MNVLINHDNRSGRHVHNWLAMVLLLMTAALLAACESTENAASDGEVIIGLTDAEGDLATYTVDVLSLTLTKSNGAVVETLPINTRVDFAQYTELTEFLTAATVPSGTYVSASMTLDYSNADIQAEDAVGDIVPVTVFEDIDGNPVDVLEMRVSLEGRDRLVIAPGIPAHITLDFDLKASNSVDFSGTEPVLTIEPLLLADVELENPKPHRVRGPLARVDVDENLFSIIMRPFHHRLVEDSRRFGTLKVNVDDDTSYEINGETFSGTEGIEAMDRLPTLTAVIAIGELTRSDSGRRFLATQVYAGSSVPFGDDDAVRGHVIARSGDNLQLRGATLMRSDGTVVFNDTLTVALTPTTKVTRQLSAADHGIDEISVGQRITAFGDLSGDSSSGYVLDTSDGLVRMKLTTVVGHVEQQDAPLAMDLDRIGRRPVALFDFSGTGVDSSQDADPEFYEINTGSLDLSDIAVDDPVKVRGFPRAFGQAPEDFDAHTVVDVAAVRGLMTVSWNPASLTAIASLDETSMTLDLDGTGRFHKLIRAGVKTDLKDLASAPVIVPAEDGTGIYLLQVGDRAVLYLEYAAFSRALGAQLDAGRPVRSFHASGYFDDATATLTSRRLRMVLR